MAKKCVVCNKSNKIFGVLDVLKHSPGFPCLYNEFSHVLLFEQGDSRILFGICLPTEFKSNKNFGRLMSFTNNCAQKRK